MHGKITVGGVAALLLIALAGPASARDSRAADRRAIEAGERAYGAAYVTGDAAVLRRLLADDFRGVDSHGEAYGKAEALKDAGAGPFETADSVGPVTVTFHGDTAIAQAREHEVGPAPEFKPSDRVFTDTWLKRHGVWRVVAAEELDPGAATPDAYAADVVAIKALRADNNRAIAAHDMAKFLPVFADDAVFVWSNGSSAVGKAGLEPVFAKDFADPAFIAYIRTPARVSVSETGQRAVEHGTWTALKHEARGDTRYGGDYFAHWARTPEGWRVRGELYVKLRCVGPLCTP